MSLGAALSEDRIPAGIYAGLERFVDNPAACGITAIVDCFARACGSLERME